MQKRGSLFTVGGMKFVWPLQTTWMFLKKLKNRTTLWPRNSTSGYLSKELQYTNLKRYMHLYVHCSIIYNRQDMEATWVSTFDKWIKKSGTAPTTVVQLVGQCPGKHRSLVWFPVRARSWVVGSVPDRAKCKRQSADVSLLQCHFSPSLPLSLKINN